MPRRAEVPPIRIPIEVTIEDEGYSKVQKKIGERKRKRETDAPNWRDYSGEEDKKRKREEEKKTKKQDSTRKTLDRLQERMLKEERKSSISKFEFIKDLLIHGSTGNTSGLMQMAARFAPFILPIILPQIIIKTVEKVSELLTQRGGFYDLTFRNIIDDRVNVLRSRESQQEIRVGFEGKSQLILTTRAGTTSTGSSYNSLEQRSNNELQHYITTAIRSTG